ncbi:MAG TPA: tetratricopeptide repeat protein [Candidatus Baltobacteraceae bacterium]|jgi:tetratricopeptide (TPR) repeat protein|nr:tetratricopeptide repeat protein [Candidatus Baltobacteraceae bacterium]
MSRGQTPKDCYGVLGFLPSRWRRDWLFGFLLLVVTFIAYQPVWKAGFIWDDDAHVTRPELRSLDGLTRIWTQLGATQQYYPLVHSVFWVEHTLWGDSPLGYHLINVLLHVFLALLLVKVLRELKIPGAWLAATLFALHPVEVESVAWVSELKNTMSGLFYLGAALAYLGFDRSRSGRNYAVALGLFVLGLMSKTVVASLPGALLVVFWWQRGRLSWRRDVLPLIPFFIAGTGAGLLTAWVERKLLHAEGAEFDFSIIERLLIAGRDIWFYLGKLIWPVDLIFHYPRWNVSEAVWWQYLFPAAVLLLAGLLVWRRWRGALAAMLFYIGTLFPALGFFNVYPFRYSLVADHFQYLASLGPLTLAAAGIMALPRFFPKGKALVEPILCGALFVVLGTLTWKQCGMYANPETLWQTTFRRNPDSWMAHNYLGLKYLQQGRLDGAIGQFQKAVEIKPGFVDGQDNLGLALLQAGKVDEAIVQFQRVLESNPGYADAWSGLGVALLQKGRVDEAISYYQKALRLKPNYPDAHYNLGVALFDKGRIDEAIIQYQEALRIEPNYADAHNNLGTALLQTGKVDEAIIHFQRALQINPEYAKAHVNLGVALLEKGRVLEALVHFRKALEIEPDDAEAHFYLGNILGQTGHMDEAIAHFRRTVEINPGYVDAHVNLGNVLLQTGKVDEAIAQFQTALQLKPDDAKAQNNLGNAFLKKGNVGEAITHYQTALQIQPADPSVQNNLAWLLATCPEASLRNGNKAVELAQQAEALTRGENPVVLHTLAAALAEAGRFSDAVETAQRALRLAEAQSNAMLADALQSEMKLYRAGSAFHSPAKTR